MKLFFAKASSASLKSLYQVALLLYFSLDLSYLFLKIVILACKDAIIAIEICKHSIKCLNILINE